MGLRHRHLFRLDPKHDVIYILMKQTQNERGRPHQGRVQEDGL
jgi:hypothetical protein